MTAAGLGVFFTALDPKNLPLTAAAALAVANIQAGTVANVVAVIGGWRDALETQANAVTITLLAVFAALLIGQGITSLTWHANAIPTANPFVDWAQVILHAEAEVDTTARDHVPRQPPAPAAYRSGSLHPSDPLSMTVPAQHGTTVLGWRRSTT